ncbi:hypothetical protein GCM10010440_78140 [Kitasatospora cinereorecta]
MYRQRGLGWVAAGDGLPGRQVMACRQLWNIEQYRDLAHAISSFAATSCCVALSHQGAHLRGHGCGACPTAWSAAWSDGDTDTGFGEFGRGTVRPRAQPVPCRRTVR